jgi:hypothetical protein
MCWSHCVLMEPLDSDQHNALMSVYDGLGSSPLFVVCTSLCIVDSLVSVCRMQRFKRVPAIRCVVELCWLGVDLCGRQSHTVVRFAFSMIDCFASAAHFCTAQPIVFVPWAKIDWIDSIDDWCFNGDHSDVRCPCVCFQSSRSLPLDLACFRSLTKNLLIGSIPSTIGLLTVLGFLYALVLTLCRSSHLASHAQGS